MATLLYRIGRFSYRSRRLVGAVWLAVIVLAGVAAATLSNPTADSFAIPGTESQEAFDLLEERFPGSSPDGAAARLVFAAPDGDTVSDAAHQQAIADAVAEIDAGPQVAEIVDPFTAGLVSEDGRVALAEVTYTVDFFSLEAQTRETLDDAVETAGESGLRVELAGTAAEPEPEPELGSELLGIAVAALVLVITFGSLLAAGMPLLTGIVGVGVGVALVTAATAFVDLSTITPILATMLGLAVGIDYALFIASRYRHELATGAPGDEAAGRAIGTAGTAVVFAGLTVVIALAGLSVVGIPMLTEMGLAAAVTVAIAVVIALTLLPALFGFAGRRMLARLPGLRSRSADPEDDDTPRLSHRWAGLVTRHPVVALTASVAGLAVLALPVLDARFGLPDEGTYPADTTQRQAYDLTVEGFGPGFNGPLLVIVDGDGAEAAATEVASGLQELDGVAMVTPPEPDAAGETAVITVVPTSGPSSPETERLVETIRAELAGRNAPAGTAVLVTGLTALYIDFSERMSQALLPYLLVVVGLSFVLLMLAFRSLVVPVKATLGFLLTMAATFGAMVAAFQWGWLTGLGVDEVGMINSMLPIIVIGIVFGLAMDYEVFLVTRMREAYVHGEPAVRAVTTGFGHGARVVTAAAIIMISVFGGFVLNEAADIRQMGFALAVAIAVDAFVVRMTIVPAVLTLVGERAWWLPRWLDRLLPNVDIEGARLTGALEDQNRQRVAVSPSGP
ncbi:MMPL family transporter [Jiangella alkaliphila]|uniref:Putative drug exporter of the RND superfamily n=1 Tax=Jiangella alkaliphila TaxID=419479 RepID=A0A1H2J3E5_9ACTN|nr:MMPL family transporter [Jiangella alkaliphila]SDU50929.1 putative drug exporter of the RND superfamily [Jiangella alkaliphila]